MEKVYNIEGVKCGGCIATVKSKLESIVGVNSVDVDIDSKKLIVDGEVSKEQIEASLSDTKFKIFE